jgi:hypothetical protein
MNDDKALPALADEDYIVPVLTLVLPAGMNPSPMLDGFMKSVIEARISLASRVRLFDRRAAEHAASGDLMRQALCRGHAFGAKSAIATLDEEIVEAFDLWQQYELSGADETDDLG